MIDALDTECQLDLDALCNWIIRALFQRVKLPS